MYDRIIVPLDGSELAEQALSEAVKLARLTGDPLLLLRVVDHTNLHGYGPRGRSLEYLSLEPVLEAEERGAEEYLQQVADRLSKTDDFSVETLVVRGLASRAIVSTSTPGDLVVMASHGRGGVSRWLLGSVAEDVMRQSQAPVLLMRAGDANQSSAEESNQG